MVYGESYEMSFFIVELNLRESLITTKAYLSSNDWDQARMLMIRDHFLQARMIARELVKRLRANLKIDWTQRESVRAQIRIAIKRILKRYKYPPGKQEMAIKTVIDKAEELYGDWKA